MTETLLCTILQPFRAYFAGELARFPADQAKHMAARGVVAIEPEPKAPTRRKAAKR